MGLTPLKIALLIADRPADIVVDQYGDYTKMFDQLLASGIESLRSRLDQQPVQVELTAFDLQQLQFPTDPNQFHAMLITGSKFSAYDPDEWINRLKQFIKQTVEDHPKVKWVGICFGHQVICEALGGKVSRNPKGWEVGWTEIELNETARQLLHTTKSQMRIQQMHKDEVSVIPEGFQLYATTKHSAYQALIKPGHILTIQSHPEYPSGAVREIIKLRHEKGIFTAEQRDRWLAVIDNQTDGRWFAEKIVGFIMDNILSD